MRPRQYLKVRSSVVRYMESFDEEIKEVMWHMHLSQLSGMAFKQLDPPLSDERKREINNEWMRKGYHRKKSFVMAINFLARKSEIKNPSLYKLEAYKYLLREFTQRMLKGPSKAELEYIEEHIRTRPRPRKGIMRRKKR